MEYLIFFGLIFGLIWFVSWIFRGLGSTATDLVKSTKGYKEFEKAGQKCRELDAEVTLVYAEMIKKWHRDNPDDAMTSEERDKLKKEAHYKVYGSYPIA